MALTPHEREAFLAEPHIGALSVALEPGRAPLTVPIWYAYEPGGELWILTATGCPKHRAIEASGRFSLMVQRTEPTTRYVTVEGPVVAVVPGREEELRRELAKRYLPADQVEGYLAMAREVYSASDQIRIRPERWLSADFGGPGARLSAEEVRAALGDVWSDAVGVRPRDEDDFFGLGGGSMELVMLLMAVEDRLGVNMSMDELFTDEFTFGASVAAVTRALDAPR